MADPEQIYSEVLAEEQGKGVASVVAEARAKAARARAEHGSPHPKEPKWWPGAQPHLDGGGDGAAPAAEEAPAEEAVPEEAPAEPEPAPEPAAAPAPPPPPPAAEAPAAPAPAPAAAPAAAAPAAATAAPPEQRPAGVTHGVPAGNRLRPEDEVQSEAQFEGQNLVYERRRRIDEVVATGAGVPAATGPRSGQWALFLVYLGIVAAAIFLVTQNKPAASEGAPAPVEEGAGGGGGLTVSAANVAFDTATLELPADEETQLEFVNDDAPSVPHNIAIYEDDSAKKSLFQGETIPGGESTTYDVPAIAKGTYYFQCDVHPGMNGDVQVK